MTGSHIRGNEIAGVNMIVIGRDEIANSGYSTLQDVLKTLPQVGPGPTAFYEPTGTQTGNFNGGTGLDLRGLGVGTTLVLVNGQRQASSGTRGLFTDINAIPTSAVERVEVLLDSASAIYGSDAIGGVVNVILRKGYKGAETTARYGTYDGDASEVNLSQTLGSTWDSGNVFVGYQFERRTAIAATDRPFSQDSDQRSNGGNNFSSYYSNPANILSPTTFQPAYAVPRNQDGTHLSASDLLPGTVNIVNTARGLDLVPEQKAHNVFLNVSQDVTDRFTIFGAGQYSERPLSRTQGQYSSLLIVPRSNAFYVNPFGNLPQAYVTYDFARDFQYAGNGKAESTSFSVGGSAKLPRGWKLKTEGGYSREAVSFTSNAINSVALQAALADPNPATALNPFGDGSFTNPATLNSIVIQSHDGSTSEAKRASLEADGELLSLPGGTVKAAIGTDWRTEALPETGTGPSRVNDLSRNVKAAFAEFAIPVVGRKNARPGLAALDLSLAARYERYSDFGHTTNPKAGVTWTLNPSVKFRGTWGKAFRAPPLINLDTKIFYKNTYALLPASYIDPKSTLPSGRTPVLLLTGANPDLKEERAQTWSTGFDLSPPALPGFTSSIIYSEVLYKNRIAVGGTPGREFNILQDEAIWYPIIERNPSAERINEICSSPSFSGIASQCSTIGVGAVIDRRLRNLAYTKERSLDVHIQQTIDSSVGKFDFGLNGVYYFANERAVVDGAPRVDILDTYNNPLSLRARGTVAWHWRTFDAGAALSYQPAYDDLGGRLDAANVATRPASIGSWTTLDVGVGTHASFLSQYLKDVELRLNVVNVFNKEAPWVNTALGYDAANSNPYGRIISAVVRTNW